MIPIIALSSGICCSEFQDMFGPPPLLPAPLKLQQSQVGFPFEARRLLVHLYLKIVSVESRTK